MFKKTGKLTSLSEQNLVDCSKSFGTQGCQGAWMANAYDYVVKNGLMATSAYPYTSAVCSLGLSEGVIMLLLRCFYHFITIIIIIRQTNKTLW